MKSTCIRHPVKETLIIIRKWQLEFCDGDHCAAALLSYFEYWHNIKLELSQRAKQANELARKHGKPATQDESLLQFHTDDDLRLGLLGLYGTKKIRSARHLLIRKEAISEHTNPSPRYAFDKTIYYLFHAEVVNAWLERYSDDLSSGKSADSIGKSADSIGKSADSIGKNAERVGKNAAQRGQNPLEFNDLKTPVRQITTEITAETTTTTTANTPQNAHARQSSEPEGSSSSSSNPNLIPDRPASREAIFADKAASPVNGGVSPRSERVSPVSERVSPTSREDSVNQQELIFDFNLAHYSPEDRARATRLLEGLDAKTAQQVLDEFNEALGNKSIKKSRWAWLRQVAQAAREGNFEPTADLNQRRRKQEQAVIKAAPERKSSQIWEEHREELLHDGMAPADYHTYITPLRGQEDGRVLWLEAPNNFVMDWVLEHALQIEQVMKLHTTLPIRVCIG